MKTVIMNDYEIEINCPSNLLVSIKHHCAYMGRSLSDVYAECVKYDESFPERPVNEWVTAEWMYFNDSCDMMADAEFMKRNNL